MDVKVWFTCEVKVRGSSQRVIYGLWGILFLWL